jgi:hypothetical protein
VGNDRPLPSATARLEAAARKLTVRPWSFVHGETKVMSRTSMDGGFFADRAWNSGCCGAKDGPRSGALGSVKLFCGLSLLFVAVSALAGCGSDPRGTQGQLGTLRFEYSTAGVCSGCALDREVLTGSLVDIDVHGANPRVTYQVRSTAPEIAEFQATTRCRFIGEEDCRDGIAVITKAAGDADLEVYDDWTGTVLDRITIKVRDAASLETLVRATPSADRTVDEQNRSSTELQSLTPTSAGVFELAVDSDVEILATAFSENGTALIATHAAFKGAYADEHVVGPRAAVAGFAPTEYAKAKSPGMTTVSVVGGGARREIVFHVVQ